MEQVNYLSLKALRLPPTIPKDLVAQHISEQERNVVGSALKGPVYQGQPVSSKNGVKTNIDIATISRGTIHPIPKGVEFSLPLDPDAISTKMFFFCDKCIKEGTIPDEDKDMKACSVRRSIKEICFFDTSHARIELECGHTYSINFRVLEIKGGN